jgi:formylmethanofuran dehydrogenase subunit E-like metal-binding protein
VKITKENLRKIIREALEEETGDRYGSENINKRTDITSGRMRTLFTTLSKIEARLADMEETQRAQGKAIGGLMSKSARDRRRG